MGHYSYQKGAQIKDQDPKTRIFAQIMNFSEPNFDGKQVVLRRFEDQPGMTKFKTKEIMSYMRRPITQITSILTEIMGSEVHQMEGKSSQLNLKLKVLHTSLYKEENVKESHSKSQITSSEVQSSSTEEGPDQGFQRNQILDRKAFGFESAPRLKEISK